MTIICDDCGKLVGRNPDCTTCVASERRVALADEFVTPGSKTTLGMQAMQAWQDAGGEVVFVSLEML